MKAVIVLAMHGIPARDFPAAERAELFRLRARANEPVFDAALSARLAELEAKMRAWPRTSANDPFHAGALQLARQLERASGLRVIVGFNEFCAPDLDEAFAAAAALAPQRNIVTTTMMTSGGTHSEIEIPAAIEQARARHPEAKFVYLWPFQPHAIAEFLSDQIQRAL
jgi:sirohydrochlorin cobaltochelatase